MTEGTRRTSRAPTGTRRPATGTSRTTTGIPAALRGGPLQLREPPELRQESPDLQRAPAPPRAPPARDPRLGRDGRQPAEGGANFPSPQLHRCSRARCDHHAHHRPPDHGRKEEDPGLLPHHPSRAQGPIRTPCPTCVALAVASLVSTSAADHLHEHKNIDAGSGHDPGETSCCRQL